MALIKCPSCGRQISDRARKCPGCGWVPGSQTEEENVSKQESKGVYKIDTNNNIEIEKLRNEKNELEKKVQELRSQNAQLSTVVKNGDTKMQEAIGKLQDEKKQIVTEKELIEQRLYEIENQAPKIVDNTDYETIKKQQKELEILQEKNIQLNAKLKEEEQKKPEVIDKTDYATLKKQADIIETLQKERDELKNILEEVEHRQAGSDEKIGADTINELKKELETVRTEKQYIEEQLKKSKNTADQTCESNNRNMFAKMMAIMFLCIIGTAIVVWIITKGSVQQDIPMKEEIVQETAEGTIKEAEEQKEESIQEDTTEDVETEENTKNSKENTAFEGEIIGNIISGPATLKGITFSYMGINRDDENLIGLVFRITNNSGKDIVLDYKANYYINDNLVYIYIGGFQKEIPNGKSSRLEATFTKSDVRMSAGKNIKDVEILFKDSKTLTDLSVVFEGLNIDIGEE